MESVKDEIRKICLRSPEIHPSTTNTTKALPQFLTKRGNTQRFFSSRLIVVRVESLIEYKTKTQSWHMYLKLTALWQEKKTGNGGLTDNTDLFRNPLFLPLYCTTSGSSSFLSIPPLFVTRPDFFQLKDFFRMGFLFLLVFLNVDTFFGFSVFLYQTEKNKNMIISYKT